MIDNTIGKMAPNSSPVVTRQDRTYSTNPMPRGSGEGEDRPSSLTCGDEFMKICLRIAVFLTNRKAGKRNIRCQYGEKMEKLTEDMLRKHKMTFKGMMERLQLNEHNIVKSFEMTIKETFADGCNFGRVVATYAFFVTIVEYCLHHCMDDKITKLQSVTANAIAEHKDWINRNGGWDGFVDQFTDTSEKIWKGFMVATVGLGALASFLYARS